MNKHLLVLSGFSIPLLLCAQTKQPNIIMLYIDDLGYGDFSCYGGNLASTPNIDLIAKEGIRFTQYYSAAPVSSPSRAALTTGMFPIRTGINTFLNTRKMNADCEQKDYLDHSFPSMARVLKSAGYTTAHFGKWHMGGGRDVEDAPAITSYGFDEYSSTWESPSPDPLLTSSNWIWANTDSVKRWNRTAYFVDKTISFLSANNNKPCFINLWPDDVHTPWVPNPETNSIKQKDYSTKQAFVPVLIEMDKQIGRLVAAIKEMGLEENTMLIITSDNGPSPSFDNIRSGNMRGTKNSLYEGGIREPLIIKWPQKIKPNQIDSTTVICAVDILASLCSILNTSKSDLKNIDGCNMANALLGVKPMKRKNTLYWDFGRNKHFISPEESYNKSPHLAIRKANFKLLCNSDGSNIQLYNLKADMNEATNLVSQNRRLANQLSKELINWYNKNRIVH